MPGIDYNSSTRFIDLTVKVGATDYSATQEVEYDVSCSNFEFFITWLTSLGAWEYWKFTGEKDYKIDLTDDIISTKNRFENWDTDFINEETGSFFASIRGFEEKEIRSGQLTEGQATALAKIKHSIQVQEIREDDSKYTILVDKGNITIRRDGDFFAEMAFNIRATDEIAIQDQ